MPTGITYCDETWNPVVGCKPVSEGCMNCFAATFASRELCKQHVGLTHMDATGRRRWNGSISDMRHTPTMTKPLRWRKPRIVLAPSMGDFFYSPSGNLYWPRVAHAFDIMRQASTHTFLVLTKRLEVALPYLLYRESLPNVVIGCTVENQRRADERLPLLAEIAAAGWRTWVSVEPLLGPVDLSHQWCMRCHGHTFDPEDQKDCQHCGEGVLLRHPRMPFEFVAVGAETGSGARPCETDWIRSVVEQCAYAGARCHVKQLAKLEPWNPDDWPREFVKTGAAR
jgi:protein gp37